MQAPPPPQKKEEEILKQISSEGGYQHEIKTVSSAYLKTLNKFRFEGMLYLDSFEYANCRCQGSKQA